ncbi:MAG: adenosylcobinamide-GDP ribazoletransferase [Peptostreptococcus sp.]|nr:adenosylcobinamide-GDP ribazoletransferase [Peptostreptococcus sp.]
MRFISILQFLTRISIKKDIGYDPHMERGIVYFPVVGAIIGLILFVGFRVFNWIFSGIDNIYLLATLILILELIITGGLHMDGFGDTFDGFFSYRSKDRILEIMRDPRLGTNGILAIVALVVLKIVAMATLIDYNMAVYLIFMPIVGRLAGVFLTYKTRPARENGMGNMFIGKCSTSALVLASLFTALSAIAIEYLIGFNTYIFIYLYLIGSMVLIFVLSRLLISLSYRRIDGITGDLLGCVIEISEVVFLIYILIVMR